MRYPISLLSSPFEPILSVRIARKCAIRFRYAPYRLTQYWVCESHNSAVPNFITLRNRTQMRYRISLLSLPFSPIYTGCVKSHTNSPNLIALVTVWPNTGCVNRTQVWYPIALLSLPFSVILCVYIALECGAQFHCSRYRLTQYQVCETHASPIS
jgi:hypothetical protein